MSRPRIGLFDLTDATSWSWLGRRLDRFVAPLDLPAAAPSFRASRPAPCTIVVADLLLPDRFAAHRDWLADAAALVIVRRVEDGDDDPEFAPLLDEQWREAVGDIQVLGWIDWRADQPAVREALALARRFASSPACPAWPEDPPVELELAQLEPTPWLPRLADPRRHLPLRAGSLAHDHRSACLIDASARLHTLDGGFTGEAAELWPRLVVRADATRLLAPIERGRVALRELASGDTLASIAAPHRYAIGLDPSGAWAWIGSRCMYMWLWTAGDRLGLVCHDAREWPCGHAKKLYGYEDNDAEWIHVDPGGACVLSVFEHDALIADAVPMRWICHGELARMSWPPPEDPLRALLFESDAEHRAAYQAEPEDEDARIAAPPVVLGRDAEHRYAVGLARETWRLRGEQAERVGGPHEGYAVFDAEHRLRRRGEGRLLGGNFGVATIEHDGALWREDLCSGERRALGPSDAAIASALPIAGTENLLLIGEDDRVRVV